MANITIFEFDASPNALGEVTWPCDKTTTGTTSDTVNLRATTRTFIVTADADCRAIINSSSASTASDTAKLPVLSAVPNQFNIAPNSGQTLKFS